MGDADDDDEDGDDGDDDDEDELRGEFDLRETDACLRSRNGRNGSRQQHGRMQPNGDLGPRYE